MLSRTPIIILAGCLAPLTHSRHVQETQQFWRIYCIFCKPKILVFYFENQGQSFAVWTFLSSWTIFCYLNDTIDKFIWLNYSLWHSRPVKCPCLHANCEKDVQIQFTKRKMSGDSLSRWCLEVESWNLDLNLVSSFLNHLTTWISGEMKVWIPWLNFKTPLAEDTHLEV